MTPAGKSRGLFNGRPLVDGFSMVGPLLALTHQKIQDSFSQDLSSFDTRVRSDSDWMLLALQEALNGAGSTNPNPAVGCVIVDSGGREIARGFTQPYRDIHAERHAFRYLPHLDRLEGAAAYVTLEPCSHQGHQPPCVDLFLNSPIARLVIATPDPNVLVDGKGIKKLRAAGKVVEIGLFQNEVRAWNFLFFAQQLLLRPVYSLLCLEKNILLSIDKIPLAFAYLQRLSQKHDAILIEGSANTQRKLVTVLNDRKEIFCLNEVSQILEWGRGNFFSERYGRPLQSVLVVGSSKFQDEFIRTGFVDAIHQISQSGDESGVMPDFARIAHFSLGSAQVSEWVAAQLF